MITNLSFDKTLGFDNIAIWGSRKNVLYLGFVQILEHLIVALAVDHINWKKEFTQKLSN